MMSVFIISPNVRIKIKGKKVNHFLSIAAVRIRRSDSIGIAKRPNSSLNLYGHFKRYSMIIKYFLFKAFRRVFIIYIKE